MRDYSPGTDKYSFSLEDGGKAMVTVMHKNTTDPSVFATIQPGAGSQIFFVVALAPAVNVLYERPAQLFKD